MSTKPWSREEEIIVFNLYCRIPFQKSSKNHPEVIKIAKLIGRSPSAVNMKVGNFGSFDDTLKQKGIVGLTNVSKLDKEIWDEFNGRWDELAYLSETLIAKKQHRNNEELVSIPLGEDKVVNVKQRINQNFFRSAILASYCGQCCITGIPFADLLIASHIKPWKDSSDREKTDPRNGLCLNALHDKAFDKGYITVTPEYKILVSRKIKEIQDSVTIEQYFLRYNEEKIILPEKFAPEKLYLEYHNDKIFLG